MKITLFVSMLSVVFFFAQDQVLAQGLLAPANAPGPTMKTLDQIYEQGAETQYKIASGASWVSGYANNSSSINAYTFVSVVNAGTGTVTVTISFYDQNGSSVASANTSLDAGESYTVSTSSGFSNALNTGDFTGYCKIESSTASIRDLIPFASFLFPTDGSSSVGNALAISGVNIPFYSRP